MDMVERVGRALAENAGRSYAIGKDVFDCAARAAIAAMREPTDDMICAGIVERHDQRVPEAWVMATQNIYAAMIDAALAEPTT